MSQSKKVEPFASGSDLEAFTIYSATHKTNRIYNEFSSEFSFLCAKDL